eukprot:6179115-Pleurochrysis_carterae.AAC.3
MRACGSEGARERERGVEKLDRLRGGGRETEREERERKKEREAAAIMTLEPSRCQTKASSTLVSTYQPRGTAPRHVANKSWCEPSVRRRKVAHKKALRTLERPDATCGAMETKPSPEYV